MLSPTPEDGWLVDDAKSLIVVDATGVGRSPLVSEPKVARVRLGPTHQHGLLYTLQFVAHLPYISPSFASEDMCTISISKISFRVRAKSESQSTFQYTGKSKIQTEANSKQDKYGPSFVSS